MSDTMVLDAPIEVMAETESAEPAEPAPAPAPKAAPKASKAAPKATKAQIKAKVKTAFASKPKAAPKAVQTKPAAKPPPKVKPIGRPPTATTLAATRPNDRIVVQAGMLHLLGETTRLSICHLLAESPTGELFVGALCERLGQSQPAVSHHLGLMRLSGLLTCRREGKQNFYAMNEGHPGAKIVRVLIAS